MYNNNMNRKLLYILIIAIILSSCKKIENITVIFDDITIDIPENFQQNYINDMIEYNPNFKIVDSYGIETKTSIYNVSYTKSNYPIDILASKEGIINGVINNKVLKEVKVEKEGYFKEQTNAYDMLISYYYGPNKTYQRSFIMINANNIIQITAIYNANSKKDNKTINDIINSIKERDNN